MLPAASALCPSSAAKT